MRRVVLLIGISCLAVVCYVETWRAFRPPIQLLLPPDATNVHVVDNSWEEWILTYRAPGSAYAWYVTVAYQLEANGWMQSGERYTGGPLFPATYTRITLLVSWPSGSTWNWMATCMAPKFGCAAGLSSSCGSWYQRWQVISFSMDA
jgi:hypothetical protein